MPTDIEPQLPADVINQLPQEFSNPDFLSTPEAGAAFGALMGGFLVAFIVLAIIIYVYSALVLMTIAKKTNTPNAWFAWVPILNTILMYNIAKAPVWSIVLFFVGAALLFIPYIGIIASLGVSAISIWWLWKIYEVRNRPGWWALFNLIQPVGMVLIGVAAWSDAKPQTTTATPVS